MKDYTYCRKNYQKCQKQNLQFTFESTKASV